MSAIVKQGEVVQIGASLIQWTPEQKELIKRTVAKDCTDDELAMFLHVAAKSGLDPLLKQIHCTKMGGRLAFIADINGLQARAAREPDYEGLNHAVVYEKDEFLVDQRTGEILKHTSNPFTNGKPVGAWAAVHRSGKLPFRSMVKFAEYDNPNNSLWKSKPSVMIDKVAKSTALRLAYPEQLGGIYERSELDKEEKEINPRPTAREAVKAKLAEIQEPKQVEAKPEEPPHDNVTGEVIEADIQQEAPPEEDIDLTTVLVPAGKLKDKPVSELTPKSARWYLENGPYREAKFLAACEKRAGEQQ